MNVRNRDPKLVEISIGVRDPSAVLTGGQSGRVLTDKLCTLLSTEILDGLIDSALNRSFQSLVPRLTKGLVRQNRSEEYEDVGAQLSPFHANLQLRTGHQVGSAPPNGSRLSCGRLARRRKGGGRSPCPARGTTLCFI